MRDESERERKRKAEGMPIEEKRREKGGKRARIRTKEQRGEDVENLDIEGQASRKKAAVTNKEGTSTQTTENQLRRRLRKGSQILSQRIPCCNQERGSNMRVYSNDVQKEMNDVILIEDDVPTSCTASEESQSRSGGSWASSGDYTPTQPFELNRLSRRMGPSSRLNCSPSQQPICDRKKRKMTDSPLQDSAQTPTTKKRTSPINSSCSQQASSLSQSTLPYYFVDHGNPSHHSSSSSQHQSKPRFTSSQSQKEATASNRKQQQNKPSTQDRTKRRKDQPHPLNDENVENQRNTSTGPLNHPSAQHPSSSQGKPNQWFHTRSVTKENHNNMARMQVSSLPPPPPPTSLLPVSCNRKSRAPVTSPALHDPLPTSTLKPAGCSLSYDRLYYSVLLSLPPLPVQHRFHALASVKEQLMPLYNKYKLDNSQFKQIANSVCDQYILMQGDQIERKSPPLTPKRIRTLRTLLHCELQKHTLQINAT